MFIETELVMNETQCACQQIIGFIAYIHVRTVDFLFAMKGLLWRGNLRAMFSLSHGFNPCMKTMTNFTSLGKCYIFDGDVAEITYFTVEQFLTSWVCDKKTISVRNVNSVNDKCNIYHQKDNIRIKM